MQLPELSRRSGGKENFLLNFLVETSVFGDLEIDKQLKLCWQAIDKCNAKCKSGRHCEAWEFTPYEFQTSAYFGYKKSKASNENVLH